MTYWYLKVSTQTFGVIQCYKFVFEVGSFSRLVDTAVCARRGLEKSQTMHYSGVCINWITSLQGLIINTTRSCETNCNYRRLRHEDESVHPTATICGHQSPTT
eukprot:UN10556